MMPVMVWTTMRDLAHIPTPGWQPGEAPPADADRVWNLIRSSAMECAAHDLDQIKNRAAEAAASSTTKKMKRKNKPAPQFLVNMLQCRIAFPSALVRLAMVPELLHALAEARARITNQHKPAAFDELVRLYGAYYLSIEAMERAASQRGQFRALGAALEDVGRSIVAIRAARPILALALQVDMTRDAILTLARHLRALISFDYVVSRELLIVANEILSPIVVEGSSQCAATLDEAALWTYIVDTVWPDYYRVANDDASLDQAQDGEPPYRYSVAEVTRAHCNVLLDGIEQQHDAIMPRVDTLDIPPLPLEEHRPTDSLKRLINYCFHLEPEREPVEVLLEAIEVGCRRSRALTLPWLPVRSETGIV